MGRSLLSPVNSLSFTRLRQRYTDDTTLGGAGAAPALARALEFIGWRAVREPTPEELAGHLALLLDHCVHEHRDVMALTEGVAMALRDTGPLLDGGLPPVAAYYPAAEALLRRYVADDGLAPQAAPSFL
jgi:hypothetical protein